MILYLAIVYALSLALSYEVQSTHAALLLGEQISGTSGSGASRVEERGENLPLNLRVRSQSYASHPVF
jgi:hypothetical protein